MLLGDEEYLFMFKEAYKSVMRYLHNDPWYVSNIDGDALTPKIISYLVYDIQHNPWKEKARMKSYVTIRYMCVFESR